MKHRGVFIIAIVLTITLFITACSPSNPPDDSVDDEKTKIEEELKEKDKKITELEEEIKILKENQSSEDRDNILLASIKVLEVLKEEDMEKLIDYIHPEKGLRFTPYQYIDLDKDVILKRDELLDAYSASKAYQWGSYDGSGETIELSFKEYYKEFVYDEEFLNPQIIGNNTSVSSGTTIDNVKEAYPDGEFVELYFKGFEKQYEGIDWKSLKLVFEKYEEKWFLVGIIHGQWTI